MSPTAALALYPLWAVALAAGFTALRLGRAVGRGLVVLCFALGIWVTNLLLLLSAGSPGAPLISVGLAERILPSGIFLGAAFLHAGADLTQATDRRVLRVAYALSAAVALLGFVAPRLLYGPGARGAGPIFFPLAGACVVGVAATKIWLFSHVRRMTGPRRSRGVALLAANVAATLGGGGAVLLRVLDLAPIEIAAPFLLVAIVVATHAVVFEEKGRSREVLVQALAYAGLTALFSAFGLTVFFRLLPRSRRHRRSCGSRSSSSSRRSRSIRCASSSSRPSVSACSRGPSRSAASRARSR
ncbi:MAG: hypothetical protein R3F14_10300 [Polyangiaceae bacterium]